MSGNESKFQKPDLTNLKEGDKSREKTCEKCGVVVEKFVRTWEGKKSEGAWIGKTGKHKGESHYKRISTGGKPDFVCKEVDTDTQQKLQTGESELKKTGLADMAVISGMATKVEALKTDVETLKSDVKQILDLLQENH